MLIFEKAAGPDTRSMANNAAVAGCYDNRGVNTTVNVYTVGHSTKTIAEFLVPLSGYGIGALADVRRFPASRRHPHFNRERLDASLERAGIEYLPLPAWGGRRRPTPDSRNTAWRNDSFRGYADHMDSDEFRSGVGRLLDCARAKRTAIMCSELLWWRCHRALVSDFLKARGVTVVHILGPDKSAEHPYTSAARLVDGVLSYAAR
ncbi:MAG TPA: DUF488 domain-containing protein [Pyrinomonadaceae bacterium]|nr:DUF488 domain-containing protein [Pyrinomonadaceae bacterium]